MLTYLNRGSKHLVVGAVVAFALTGCGAGSKVVTNVAFNQETVGNEIYAGIDATLAAGGIRLPYAKLPLYDPKNPSRSIGEIETNDLHVIVRVNASAALNLPDLADGTKLPNGAGIPLDLPAGLKPVAIPAFNSNSIVYVAIHGKQILVGVAVSIAKNDGLNLPIDLFLPFTINSEISGTAGFFLGQKQGIAVFALKESAAAPAMPSFALAEAKSLVASPAARAAAADVRGRIEVKSARITTSLLKKFKKAKDRMRDVRVD